MDVKQLDTTPIVGMKMIADCPVNVVLIVYNALTTGHVPRNLTVSVYVQGKKGKRFLVVW